MKITLPLLGAAAVLATGCIHHTETVYRDVSRVKVEFENDAAGRMFYEALSKSSHHHGKETSKTDVSIPIVFSHTTETVTGENYEFNEAVKECDTNQDGIISETEARIFADRK